MCVRTIEVDCASTRRLATECDRAGGGRRWYAAEPAAPRRELSVEELIDLEQQADFFVVLGQDEAAIDLLMGHVRSSGGVSPLPYLKLLEIYRRRGEREAYERIRERFNRRFNAYAPDWDADLQHGRTLDDYPQVLAPAAAPVGRAVARHADARRVAVPPRRRGETFDLPAYRELLFLYSMARDLAEHPSQRARGRPAAAAGRRGVREADRAADRQPADGLRARPTSSPCRSTWT